MRSSTQGRILILRCKHRTFCDLNLSEGQVSDFSAYETHQYIKKRKKLDYSSDTIEFFSLSILHSKHLRDQVIIIR